MQTADKHENYGTQTRSLITGGQQPGGIGLMGPMGTMRIQGTEKGNLITGGQLPGSDDPLGLIGSMGIMGASQANGPVLDISPAVEVQWELWEA